MGQSEPAAVIEPPRAFALRARWVLPVEGAPLSPGVVTIADGRIVAIGATSDVEIWDLGDVAIMPGLVNAHTHLEFSHLAQPLGRPGNEFVQWIGEVVAHRQSIDPGDCASLEAGIAESVRSGTTTLGEISTRLRLDPAREYPLRIFDFAEVICFAPERNAEMLARLSEELATPTSPSIHRGISPHAPYTVNIDLVEQLVALASRANVPLAMHLAESPAELELLASCSGPFYQRWMHLGIWDPRAYRAGSRVLDYLRILARAPRALVVHANYLDDEEVAWLATQRERMSVVYCPRTHAYFGHPPHPLPQLLAAGANVALGTDGRSSNPDLSLLAEMRFLAGRNSGIPLDTILRLGTLAGAEALGIARETGSLIRGKVADLAVIRLASGATEPYEAVLAAAEPVVGTMRAGRWTWLDPALIESAPAGWLN